MKRLFTLLLISFAALSCEMIDEKLDDLLGKRDWVVFAEGTELTANVPSKQTVLNYKFESTLDWEVKTDAEWIELDRKSGKAGKNLKIQVKVLKNKGTKRTGHIDLTPTNGKIYRITINQDGADDQENGNDDIATNIPNNQIWYTTTTGEIVVPNNDPYESNSTIISNTYTDGQGIITFRDDVVEIADFFLTYNDVLETLTLPSTLTRIGSHAFADCTTLSRINIPKSITYIENSVFDYDQIAAVIYEGSYDDWFNIYFETRGSNPVHNGGDLYIDGEPLCGEVIVPSYITDLGHFFTGISAETFILHDKITTISQKAFEDCKALKYITIPESVEIIEDGAFADCISLESVYCKPTIPPYLGCEVFILIEEEPCFTNIGNTIYVPVASYYDYIYAEGWREYAKYIVAYDYDRNEVVDIERPEKPNEIANNQIWYTSLYNDTIYPYDSEAFNAEIVSNIYYGDYGVITFDGELTEIGDYAFAHCWGLRSLSLPESVTSVGECLIKDCPTFESFGGKFATEDGTALIANDTLVACAQNTSSDLYIIPDGVKRIATCAFRECENITALHIPDSVESIGEGAFSSSLGFQYFNGKHVTDDGLAVICDNTFIGYAHGNENRSYTIPNGVTRIGWYAFDNSIYLNEITIPESVVEIGDVALAYCYNLSTIYCRPTTPPVALYDYNGGWESFDCNMYDMTIYVPQESYYDYIYADGWQNYSYSIVGYDFANSEYPETPNRIPNNQIWYTTADGEIVEPNDTTAFNVSIISNSYKNGKGVITFDGIVSIIGDYAFYGCNFESITMPASVTYCGDYAFGACYNLQKVHITDLSAWCNIDFKHDANPLNGSDIYIGENRIVDLVIPSDVTKIKANTFGGCRSIESVSIHSGIEIIESQAFIACSNLKRFYSEPEFGDGLSLIINGRLVSYALNCGVSEYTIPEGVTYIDDSAFAVCYTLNKITIPESVQNIAQSAFAWCGNLSEVYCMAQTPPTAVWEKTPDDALSEYWNAFNSTSSDIKIYVPRKSVETYKRASGWSEYAQYIVGYDF